MRDIVKNYVKRPVTVRAIQFNGANIEEVRTFVGNKLSSFNRQTNTLRISTQDGMAEIKQNEYVIQGVEGDFYRCTETTFDLTYEEYKDEPQESV